MVKGERHNLSLKDFNFINYNNTLITDIINEAANKLSHFFCSRLVRLFITRFVIYEKTARLSFTITNLVFSASTTVPFSFQRIPS